MAECAHPQRLGNMCAACGKVLDGDKTTAKVALSCTPAAQLSVTKSEASALSTHRATKLEARRRLQLVLDLDHTLLECSTDPRAEGLVASDGVVRLGVVAGRAHWVRLRPRLAAFFEAVAPLYELAIYTHGTRDYAEAVRRALEAAVPGLQFGRRVVSRDDCPDLRGEKSLERLFPGGADRALILDDRLDVWTRGEDQTPRVLVVQPYSFFAKRLRAGSLDDRDSQLQHSARALVATHAAFYDGDTAGGDVCDALDVARRKVFAGCVFFFACDADVYVERLARRHGGARANEAADATHVVALEACDVDAVHLDWFWYSVWRCRREPDAKYALPARVSKKRPRDEPRTSDAGTEALPASSSDDDDAWAADLEGELFS